MKLLHKSLFLLLAINNFPNIIAQKKPNIIVILADDIGYGDFGAYGQKLIHTPNIDALAAGGIKFTNYYSGSSVCAPSRETLLTGMHTGHTYIRGNFLTDEKEDPAMPPEKITIAEYLEKQGYQTALFGKWGLGGEGKGPETQGFQNSFCYLDQIKAHNYYPPFLYEDGKKITIEENENDANGMYSHYLFADKTLSYIKDRSADKPFFLYLPYTLPHGGYTLPPEPPYTSQNWNDRFKVYATMISLLDKDVGRIVQELKQKGIFDNTLILIASDNGANFAFAKFFNSNGPYSGGKFGLKEGGIRVPLIAYWNGRIKAGQQSGHLTASWDIFPTLCDAAGASIPKNIDGISFLPELTGNKQEEHQYLYWEYFTYNYNWDKPDNKLPRNYRESRAVRFGKWKGLQQNMYKDRDAPIELYDMATDPGEENNVAVKHVDIIKKITRFFNEASVPDPPFFPYKK